MQHLETRTWVGQGGCCGGRECGGVLGVGVGALCRPSEPGDASEYARVMEFGVDVGALCRPSEPGDASEYAS
jgi:hypothetical protein